MSTDTTSTSSVITKRPPIRGLRWWIAGLLFAVTVINYIDRQTLSALSPILKERFSWTDNDYALITNIFRVSYTVMQFVFGWALDWMGTRQGIGLSVAFYSTVAACTASATGFWSFASFRFLLGAGEATNNPGGSKAVSEWFPAKERAWAVGIFNSGCAVGGAIAPVLALGIYKLTGAWQWAFVLTATLGFFWLFAWVKLYRRPEEHPRLSPEELAYIRAGQTPSTGTEPSVKVWKLLTYRQTWGIILGRFLLDPYWFFMGEWLPILLKSKGFTLTQSVLGSSAPFLGAMLGNYFAGWLSGYLIRRGWAVGRSRRTLLLVFGLSMTVFYLASKTNNYYLILALYFYTSFAYTCCGTMFLTLPADVFHTRAVGTVMGLGGTGAGIGTLLSTYIIGKVSPTYGFDPIILGAAVLPCIAVFFFYTLVRADKKDDPAGVLMKF